MSVFAFQDVSVVYGTQDSPTHAVSGFSLEASEGSFISLLGPSGCGKSTLLMLLAGIIEPSSGRVLVDGNKVDGPGPGRAVVFQEPGLLPWRRVLGNIEFGAESGPEPREKLRKRAKELLSLVGLDGFSKHYPLELSGGMKQRVNLARALMANPTLLLMDEPFAALDAQTRDALANELLRIWNADRKTVLFVTHSIEEAVFLSDRVAVMTARPGKLKAMIDIDIPRPRSEDVRVSEAFIDYRNQIWKLLRRDAEHVTTDAKMIHS